LAFFLLLVTGFWEILRLGHSLSLGLYVPLASLALGFLFFCLFILVVHEASHFMFVHLPKQKWSRFCHRFFGWMVCIPFGVNFKDHWEKGHLVHHRQPMESPDPQICNPRTGKELLKQILMILLIPAYIHIRGMWKGGGTEYDCAPVRNYQWNLWRILLIAIFWSALLITIYFLNDSKQSMWPQAFAIILGIQVLSVFTVIKTGLEHGGVMRNRENEFLRQWTSRFRLRYLLLPFNISYHFEHHLNYAVPWYLLPKYFSNVSDLVPAEIKPLVYNHHPLRQILGEPPNLPTGFRSLKPEGVVHKVASGAGRLTLQAKKTNSKLRIVKLKGKEPEWTKSSH
jgi:fatty acid desaturase